MIFHKWNVQLHGLLYIICYIHFLTTGFLSKMVQLLSIFC